MVETLKQLKKDWELMVFTASAPEFANKIIDQIDPDGSIFSARLFRDHCFRTEKGLYIKDLRIINRPPQSIVLVDNAAYSYGFQPFNGVPIIPFEGSDQDLEMLFLKEYLDYLLGKADVRKVNREVFKYHLYLENLNLNKLTKKLFK